MANGKIFNWIKSNWRTCLYVFAVFAGIVCGVWACSKSPSVSVDANRNRITIMRDTTKK